MFLLWNLSYQDIIVLSNKRKDKKTDLHSRRDTGQEGSVTDGELHDEVQDAAVQAEAAECYRAEHGAPR